MYLTDKKNGAPRELRDHDELELLLEFFAKQVEEIVNEAENIQVSDGRVSLRLPEWSLTDCRVMCNRLRRSSN